ncbi:MAG: ABC transporter substrate-binding protein [bacterium]
MKKLKKHRPHTGGLWVLLVCIYSVALPHSPAYGRPVKVNVGVRGYLPEIAFHIGKEKGHFRKEGLDVRLVPVRGGVGPVINTLANGTVDVFPVSFSTNLVGLMRESGIKIVAGYAQHVKGMPSSSACLVRKDLSGKIKTFADLRGRIIAIPAAGTPNHISLLQKLAKAGLTENDFTSKSVEHNMLPAMLAKKEIDISVVVEPLMSQIINIGLAEVFAGTDIADETMPVSVLCYSRRFMKNEQAAGRFMVAVLRSVREFYRAAPEQINDIAIKIWGMPIDAKILSRLNIASDGKIDTQSLMAAQEYALRKGWVKAKVNEKDFIDSSYVRYANEVLSDEDKGRKNTRTP